MLEIQEKDFVIEVRFVGRRTQNLITWDVLRELRDFALDQRDNSDTRAIILTGAPDVFTIGFDLETGIDAIRNTDSLKEQRALNKLGSEACLAWEKLQCFTICAIEGFCVGGGAALALSCDSRIIGESGKIYIPEILRAMNLGWGAIPRLVNLVGPARAKQACILPRPLLGSAALGWGLVDACVPDGSAMTAAREMAAEVTEKPPVAVQFIKRSINAYANALADAASFADGDQFLVLSKSVDFDEAINSFLERRPANYTGA